MASMIVVAGEALIDILVGPDGRRAAVRGGGPYNTARTIGRLGGDVAFLGALSSDRFGRWIHETLALDGVDRSMTIATESPTTLAIAELDEHGRATYRFHTSETSAPELTLDAVVAALATRPAAVHLGTLGLVLEPMASALATGIAGADSHTMVMLDPNSRPRVVHDRSRWLERVRGVMARADIVKVSTEDLVYLSPATDASEAARGLLDLGPAVVLLTDGPHDVRVMTREGAFEVPVAVVAVADTVGAGDAFGGGFLALWIERGWGRPELKDHGALREAVTYAVAVASATCRRPGADPPWRTDLAWPAGPLPR
jgi:fructokinase